MEKEKLRRGQMKMRMFYMRKQVGVYMPTECYRNQINFYSNFFEITEKNMNNVFLNFEFSIRIKIKVQIKSKQTKIKNYSLEN